MQSESNSVSTRRRSPLYAIWSQMRYRCENPKHPAYSYYGARGITVSREWSTFPAFREWSTAHGYRAGLTLDRIDNDGPYAPENCRWVGRDTQANNMRSNHRIVAFGEERTITEWSRDQRCRVTRRQLQKRIDSGWNAEVALSTPPAQDYLVTAFGETKSIFEWSRDPRCAISYDALRHRLNEAHWDAELAITAGRQHWRRPLKLPELAPPS